ncbi:MAG: UDP-N-acetylmuramoyl-tripeptide--D-alanyl-D-alanine ligase, partial [Firmicutes bacterium]|nr:UDP-N-acetylmuramoyl-tripeptide--D-alanyl-D-alanine ligase [Bacillota bacterium]
MNENYAKLYLTSLDAEDIAKATWGELHKQNGGWGRRESVLTTDSRIKEEHGIFAAITGERVDGHLFIADELRRGVRIIIAEHMPEYGEGDEDAASIPADFIIVNNTVSALLRLGCMFIEKSGVKRIAVTGSVGKTTTKEFIYSVLSQRRKTHKTSGNKNTAIGTSLTALEIECDAEYAVFECGMSGFGEISEMSRTICPHIGVITNIGTAHMEMLGSRENIAKAKLEMLDGMNPDSVLIIN